MALDIGKIALECKRGHLILKIENKLESKSWKDKDLFKELSVLELQGVHSGAVMCKAWKKANSGGGVCLPLAR